MGQRLSVKIQTKDNDEFEESTEDATSNRQQ